MLNQCIPEQMQQVLFWVETFTPRGTWCGIQNIVKEATMLAKLFDLEDYAGTSETRNA